jgi:hypothetical protein
MKKFILIFTILLSSFFVYPTQASAQQMCFFEIPDSAWSNGEPFQVTSKLNFNLVGKKTSNVPLLSISNLTYEGITFLTAYEYSGTECSTRLIKVAGNSNGIEVIYKSVEDWKTGIRKSAKNFEAEKLNIDTVDKVLTKINNSVVTFKVNGKIGGYQTDRTAVLSEMTDVKSLTSTLQQLGYVNDQPYFGQSNNYLTILQSKGDCIFYPTTASSYDGLRDGVKTVGISGRFASSLKFETLKDCSVKILLASPSTWGGGLDTMKTGLTGFIQLADVVFRPQLSAPSKVTINCIKGKLTKKVTTVNPKCPAGYKKA